MSKRDQFNNFITFICTFLTLLIVFSNKFEVMRKMTLLIVLLSFTCAKAQSEKDSILLLNGKVFKGEITGTAISKGDSVVNYNHTNKKGKVSSHEIETRRIFSYTRNGTSRTVYMPNEFIGDYLTVRQAHDVTIGSYDARQTFKPHVAFWTGFGLGLGASIWDTYLTKKAANDSSLIAPKKPGFFKGEPSVFPFLVPIVASVTWALPSFKLKKKNMIHKNYHGNEYYYRGYHRIAKQKRMLGGLFGSVAGLGLGMILYFIFH